MATFGITPVSVFPPPTADEFPQFIQFQNSGVDLGGPDADTVNFANGLVATRGTGEQENIVTVTGEGLGLPPGGDTNQILAKASVNDFDVHWVSQIQFQDEGIDLGPPDVAAVNFVGSLVTATRGTGETVVVEIEKPAFTWNHQTGDYTLALSDNDNGIAMDNTSGSITVHIPADETLDLPIGYQVLVFQEGASQVSFSTESGVDILVRSALLAMTAGQYATATLIKRDVNRWILCGDLELA